MKAAVTLELLAELSNKGFTVLHGKDNILTPVKWDWEEVMNNDEYKRFEDDNVIVISESMEFWDPSDVIDFTVDVP